MSYLSQESLNIYLENSITMKGLRYIAATGIMAYTLSTGCKAGFDIYIHKNPVDNKKQKTEIPHYSGGYSQKKITKRIEEKSEKTLESRTNNSDRKTSERISNKIDLKINFYKDSKDKKIISYDPAKEKDKKEDKAYDTKKQEEQIKDNSKEQKKIDEKKSEPIKKKKKRSFWHDGSLYQYEVDTE